MNRSIVACLTGICLLFLIFGCGGSGGGGATTGGDCEAGLISSTVDYSTNWGSNGIGAAQSQLVTLINKSGAVVKSQVLNRSLSENSLHWTGVASGDYAVRAEIFSGADAQGTSYGVLYKHAALCGSFSLTSEVGGIASSMEVTPANAQVKLGNTQNFYATVYTTTNAAIFTAPGAIIWSTTGNVGTIDTTGKFTATGVGTGNVAAQYSSTLSASTPANVYTGNATRSKWTILVYINAANDLFPYSDLNVNQMESVATNSNVRVVLQWKQSQTAFPNSSFNGTRRYLVKSDSDMNTVHSEVVQDMGDGIDMGLPETMNDFIRWGKANYPADRTALVIWNHGNGWHRGADSRAFSYDDATGSSIQIWELEQAFGSQQLEFIAWDCSLMQMFECAYELRHNSKYIIGGEESPPGEGYPYQLIFNRFASNPDDSTLNLTKGFVDGMLAVPEYATRKITQSVLDTAKLDTFCSKLNLLAQSLIGNDPAVATAVANARANAKAYSQSGTRYYRDIIDLMDKLLAETIPDEVRANAQAVKVAATDAIVWEGHNGNSSGSHGVSIEFAPKSVFQTYQLDYSLQQFAEDTFWDEYLRSAQ